MANLRHPNFILALLSILVALFSVGFYNNHRPELAMTLMWISIAIGGIHWLWSIFDVYKTDTLQEGQKVVWFIVVIVVPVVGGMLYYMLHSKRDTIVD